MQAQPASPGFGRQPFVQGGSHSPLQQTSPASSSHFDLHTYWPVAVSQRGSWQPAQGGTRSPQRSPATQRPFVLQIWLPRQSLLASQRLRLRRPAAAGAANPSRPATAPRAPPATSRPSDRRVRPFATVIANSSNLCSSTVASWALRPRRRVPGIRARFGGSLPLPRVAGGGGHAGRRPHHGRRGAGRA